MEQESAEEEAGERVMLTWRPGPAMVKMERGRQLLPFDRRGRRREEEGGVGKRERGREGEGKGRRREGKEERKMEGKGWNKGRGSRSSDER